ncbi:MAG: hypothetical protein M3331_02300 [Actinomycetota bacterium]|nr:hypothetical protein [Actinomycetota bacterium]
MALQQGVVLVALMLIGALLVDRFVLLPEFDDGEGSAGVALAAWLGVNLLPALAWLALNARRSERTPSQLGAGTLAVIATTAILIVPVLIWWTADEDAVRAPGGDAAQASSPQPPTREAELAAQGCGRGGGPKAGLVTTAPREHFADAAPSAPSSLLMEGTRFRPGEKFAVAVRNEGVSQVTHGAGATIEDADTGETVEPGMAIMTPLVALVVPSGQVGPCVAVLIPSSAEPGLYRTVLSVSSAPQTAERLEGEFEIAGEPIAHGWEQELKDARKKLGR